MFWVGNCMGNCSLKSSFFFLFFFSGVGPKFALEQETAHTWGDLCLRTPGQGFHEHSSKILWQIYLGWNKPCKFYFENMAPWYNPCFLLKDDHCKMRDCFIACRPTGNPSQVKHLEQARPGKAFCSSDFCHMGKGWS